MKPIINFYRILITLLIALGLGLMFIRIKSHAQVEEPSSNQKIEVVSNIYDTSDEIKNIFIKNNNLIINFDGYAKEQKNFNRNLFLKDEFILIDDGVVDDYQVYDKTEYYLICNLLMSSNGSNLIELIDFNCYGLNTKGFVINESTIYAFGDIDDDAAVLSFDLDGNDINQFVIGGLQKETFLDGFVVNDKIFLIGKKDSVSHESELLNVGLPNTEKIFMINCDLDLNEKKNEIYFNQIRESEEYIDYLIFDNSIYIHLNSCIFKMNLELELVSQEFEIECDLDSKYFLVVANDKVLKIKNHQGKITIDNQLLSTITGDIVNMNVYNGNLEIYSLDGEKILFYKIAEYHISKNETIIANRYNPEINFQNKLIVESYFEDLDINVSGLNPVLPKNIDGKYQVSYEVTKEDGHKFIIEGEYELKPFVNIVNGGIYQPLKELFFYGNATLNGTTIYNGYKVKDEGSYTLTLTNANGKTTTYLFQIVDGYYKDDDSVTIETDINIEKNRNYSISIDYKGINQSQVKSLLINGEKYTNFVVTDNKIIINLIGDSKYGIKNIHIDKIEYENGGIKEYVINKNYLVRTIKDSPKIILNKEIRNQKIQLDFEFNDQDKSISYLKTEIYKGNNLVMINYNYLNKEMKLDNASSLKDINCKHYLVSYNGYEYVSTILMEYELTNCDYNKFMSGKCNTDYCLNSLEVTLNPKSGNLKTLNVNNNDLIKNLKITDNNLNVTFIIILSFIIFLVGIVALFVIKKVLLSKKTEKIKYKI